MESKIEFIRYALNNKEILVIATNCEIDYEGRAEARLEAGDRIILIKKDNTLIVHQPEGNNPVNYMKPETKHSLILKEGSWFISSENTTLKEYMNIKINDIYFVNSTILEDNQKLKLAGSEKDMAEMIYKNPALIDINFKPLSMEEHTKYGFIDVFGHDNTGNLVVIECKRDNADLSAVQQLRRYVEKISSVKGTTKVKGIIAAPKITTNAEKMLIDFGYTFKEIHPPKKMKISKDQQTLGEFVNGNPA